MSLTSTSPEPRRLPHRRRDSTIPGAPAMAVPRVSVRMLAVASLISLSSFLWFFFRHEILLYGDAVAHINIARQVFDSIHPGPLRFGSVWLPLPHLLIIPFIIGHNMWTSGWGASVPSMIAYVVGLIGIYKLVGTRLGTWPAIVAAAVFGLNPNLLYLQSTAMTEPVFLATFIWSLVYLDRYLLALDHEPLRQQYPPEKSLEFCAIALAASILTRYDGWAYSAIFGIIILARSWTWRKSNDDPAIDWRMRRSLLEFFLLCLLVPTLWLAQNYALTGHPLDFMNGPYSAKAIEARSINAGGPLHPGTGSLWVSTIFFLKDAKLNVSGGWLEIPFFLVALLGLLLVLRYRAPKVFLLFLLPLPFYAYSIAYGSIPIFMPQWWPHSYYNVRYGIELLPAFAVFAAITSYWLNTRSRTMRWAGQALVVIIVAASYILVATQTPISLREARVNSVTRIMLENRLADALRHTPPNSIILMKTVNYIGALQRAGIPLRNVIWEGAHTQWEESLAAPAKYADYVVAIQGDDVWYATRLFPQHLVKWVEFQTPDKPRVTLYKVERN